MILLTQGAQFGCYDKKVRFQTIYTHPLDACLALRLLLFLKEHIGNKLVNMENSEGYPSIAKVTSSCLNWIQHL